MQKFDLKILQTVTCLSFLQHWWNLPSCNLCCIWWFLFNVMPTCCTYQTQCMTLKIPSRKIFPPQKMVVLVVWISEMSKAYKNTLKNEGKCYFSIIFVFFDPETMSPKLCGAQVALLHNSAGTGWGVQNSAGHRLSGPKLLQPVPCGVFEQCNLCPAEFWRHSFRDQHNH